MIYVILPSYNEEKNILSTVKSFSESLGAKEHKIIVVNDGSLDLTSDILLGAANKYPVFTIDNERNLGVGPAFLKGIKFALADSKSASDMVVIAEADNTSDARILDSMICLCGEGADIVIASRFLKGGTFIGFPLGRLIISRCANAFLRMSCRIPGVTDYTIFYRLYKMSLLSSAWKKYGEALISNKGFEANAQLLFNLSRLRPKIMEIAFKYNYSLKRSVSKINILRTTKKYISIFHDFHKSK